MWFDVEERYNATEDQSANDSERLWFDVEERYNATLVKFVVISLWLWFDVEERYNATGETSLVEDNCCGLM